MSSVRSVVHVTPGADGAESEWATSPANLHIHNHRFDEYDTEVFSLNSEYEHRGCIRDLDWETTHRTWTGDAWKIDFAALETVVQHLLDCGFPCTIEPSILRIYTTDFDAPFLETLAPSASPPDEESANIDDQLRLQDFSNE